MSLPDHTWAAKTFWSERPLGHRERQLTQAVGPWVARAFQYTDRPCFLLTLTCKQTKPDEKGNFVWLSPDILKYQLEIYFRRIDWQVYRNASRRGKKAIERFCVIEGGAHTDKRIHIHLLVLAPPRQYMEPMEFVRTMILTWQTSPWGMKDAHWEHAYDPAGAARYLMKTGLDAIDWHNTKL